MEWLAQEPERQIVAARLDPGVPAFDLIKCPADDPCCAPGHGGIGLISDLTEKQGRFVGVEPGAFPASRQLLMVRLLAQGRVSTQCEVDQTGWCCAFPRDAFGKVVLARGLRTDATTLEDATLCFPRAPAYDERGLPLTTPGVAAIEQAMADE